MSARIPAGVPTGRASRRSRLLGAAGAAAVAGAATATSLGPATHISPLWFAAAAALAVALVPRGGYLALSVAAVGWLALAGQPGAALLLLLALAPGLLLLRSSPWLWLVPALAPALGALSLATAYPAAASRVAGAWRRAALGGLGLWWVLLAEPLYGRRLLLGVPPGARPRVQWQASVPDAVSHAVVPIVTHGGLLLAVVWALAAVAAPWIVRGATVRLRVAGAVAWAVALLTATAVVGAQLGGLGTPAVVAGAAVAAVLALLRPPATKPGRAELA